MGRAKAIYGLWLKAWVDFLHLSFILARFAIIRRNGGQAPPESKVGRVVLNAPRRQNNAKN